MPFMGGVETIERIRQEDKDVTILIVLAHSDAKYLTNSIKAGIQGYVIKPTSMEQLIEVLEALIDCIKAKQTQKAYHLSL